ncbi:MAG: hypothetical protein HY519_02460 [Candidatus Aenigmarchaeota archaeon]|nr:hypothetical protein [Candidatus Aenigmarchaeota archaeon]
MTKDIREQIRKTLAGAPYGMTIGEIAQALKVHRYTATKYIFELIGRESIFCKDVGKAKLCFLVKEKVKGTSAISIAVIFALLWIAGGLL